MLQRYYHIAAGLLWHNDALLLVQQQGPTDAAPLWSLPGGIVEAGELLTDALTREVNEETGLTVTHIGPLAYVVQLDDHIRALQSWAFVFDVMQWAGTVRPHDPDAVVIAATFCSRSEAIAHLQTLPWRFMSEPLIAYLNGTAQPGQVWCYRHGEDGVERLLTMQATP